jgi:hypothetical protein
MPIMFVRKTNSVLLVMAHDSPAYQDARKALLSAVRDLGIVEGLE